MAILDILNKPVFASRFKLPLHIVTGILVVIVVGLSVPRLFMKNQPRTRAGTIALGMGAKSLILLSYMLATEHVRSLRRWHSYKANAIISCLEIVFWGAVAFLVFQANLSKCEGVMCYLSWVVVGIAVVINQLEIYGACIAIREFRESRKAPSGVLLSSAVSRGTDEEEMVATPSSWPQSPQPARYHAQVVRGKQ
ncbi:hypothetical protein C7974DRAFT_418569 [Boeremia exigua]|uniref:uncharacterized protein n=1 Tax=Boeremia exigua TaxID=749465 RepID=UPI001E8DB7B3|nr:uncharacterized protein C7974DRAFT_418569 [Boeremia exigua]KAH6612630.1 hypothetical protein C7974DRAFT_418569 [Boeremia exigua]